MPSWLKIVNPTAQDVIVEYTLAARLPALQGARIGVINNSKHMAAEFLEALEEQLRVHYGVEITEIKAASPASILNPGVLQGQTTPEGILITRLNFDQQRLEFEKDVNFMLLNVETALHPGLCVPGNGAEVLVDPLAQIDGERG